MPTEARGICPSPLTNARQSKDLSQPASRGVDTTYWQLFRLDINTAHIYFFAEVTSHYLTTDGLKIFSLLDT